MKKTLKMLFVFVLIISCSDNNDDFNMSDKDTTSINQANPKLKWKKLVYKNFKKEALQNDSVIFDKNGFLSEIKEFMGVRNLEEKNYNLIKQTFFYTRTPDLYDSISSVNYFYARDSSDYTIKINIDTIDVNQIGFNCISFSNVVANNTDDKVKYELLDSVSCLYRRSKIERYKSFLKSNFEEVVLDNFTTNLEQVITSKGSLKSISTDAGVFESNEYLIIGRNPNTNERIGEGESTLYYHEDFLVQEFISVIYKLSYTHKKELVDIQYNME